MSSAHDMPILPAGCVVGNYELRGVLGAGGFGITYLAVHRNTHGKVAIKEYLPRAHAHRDAEGRVLPNTGEGSLDTEVFRFGLERFLREARSLEQVQHPYIVRVRDYFESNGTAYLVMNYAEGLTLERWLDRHEGAPDEETLLTVFLPLLDGLHEVHSRGLVHRDIKPSNIYLCNDGTPLLIDFGAARSTLDQHGHVTQVFTPGYSPSEQYGAGIDLPGPRTDLYAVGATLLRCVSGANPPDAGERAKALGEGRPDPLPLVADLAAGRYSVSFLNAIDHCLARNAEHRPTDVRSLQEHLSGERDPGRFDAEPRGAARDVPATRRVRRGDDPSGTAATTDGESGASGAVRAKEVLRQPTDDDSGQPGVPSLEAETPDGSQPGPDDPRDHEGVGGPCDEAAGTGSVARGLRRRRLVGSMLGVVVLLSILLLIGVLVGEPIASSAFRSGWLLDGMGSILGLLCLGLIVTPLGKVRLGGKAATPDLGRLSWLAMLLAAGVCVGFPFYNLHPGDRVDVGKIYQWGFQVWTLHAVIALSLALLAFNRELPLSFRSTLRPLSSKVTARLAGRLVDHLVILVTVYGLPFALGAGALLLSNELFEPADARRFAFAGIAAITAVALVLVMLGLEKGIRIASLVNLSVAVPLLALAFYNGETSGFLWSVVDAPAEYVDVVLSTAETTGDAHWRRLYWLPWIACAPFVGVFIARISRGRTVRELLLGALVAPSVLGLIWLSALESHYHDSLHDLIWVQAPNGLDSVLFPIALLTIALFLVTSLAAGAWTIATIAAGGRPDGSVPKRVAWCVLMGLTGMAMLFPEANDRFGLVAVPAVLALLLLLLPMCLRTFGLLREERARTRHERDVAGDFERG